MCYHNATHLTQNPIVMQNFIIEFKQVFSTDYCQHLINKFEQSQHKQTGRTGAGVEKNKPKSVPVKAVWYWHRAGLPTATGAASIPISSDKYVLASWLIYHPATQLYSTKK
jgi:hypothetical protein